jgi:soluble lytic murein transglycosylase-like protein
MGAFMKILYTLIIFTSFILLNVEAKTAPYKKNALSDSQLNKIVKMIKKVQPELNEKSRKRIAKNIYKAAQDNKVDPQLMIAIIDTESNFAGEKISSTGDLSMAQINTHVWNKEFKRLGLKKISDLRLKKDEVYALSVMGQILGILKNRHAKKDKNWYARYHSKTKKYNTDYRHKVDLRLRMIASIS